MRQMAEAYDEAERERVLRLAFPSPAPRVLPSRSHNSANSASAATKLGGAVAQLLCGHEVGVGSVLPDNLQVLRPRRSAEFLDGGLWCRAGCDNHGSLLILPFHFIVPSLQPHLKLSLGRGCRNCRDGCE